MLGIEDIMCELEVEFQGEGGGGGLPPGFRFHPTDEELITFYLASKVFNGTFSGVDIAEVDLNRCEPWELPEVAKMGEREWYFFSLRDRKYPTGLRTNRATGAGYWKATGKDREVYSSGSGKRLLGMKKTLVFYKGRAPRGEKTKWVMHEYRLEGDFSYRHTCKDEWVICRIFHKIGDKKHSVNIIPQLESYQIEENHQHHTSTTTTYSLPPLLESTNTTNATVTTTTITPSLSFLLESPPPLIQPLQSQNHFLYHPHENDLIKSLSSPSPTFPIFQTPPPNSNTNKSSTETNANPSTSAFLKSFLLSNQDYFTPTTSVPKQCKTEPIFSQINHHPSPPPPQHFWGLDNTNSNHHQHHHHQISTLPSYCQDPMLDFTTMGFNSSINDGGGTKLVTGGTTSTSSLPFNKSALHQMLLDMI